MVSKLVSVELSKASYDYGEMRRKFNAADTRAVLAEAKYEKARAARIAAQGETQQAKNELAIQKELSRQRETAAVVAQGEVLRAFAEKLFLSNQFSAFIGDMLNLMTDNAGQDPEVFLPLYGREIAARLQSLPLLEELASSSALLSAEQVRSCRADSDERMEAVFASLGPVPPASIFKGDEQEAEAGKEAEQQEPQSGDEHTVLVEQQIEEVCAELEGQQLGEGGAEQGGGRTEAEAEAEVDREKEAETPREAGDEAVRELEILHWKRLYSSALNEAEKRAIDDQVKYDELLARVVELESKNKDLESEKKDLEAELEIPHPDLEAELNAALAERNAYEDYICRHGGKSIPEVQNQVDELWERFHVLRRDNNALESSACQQVVKSLRRLASLYKVVLARRPAIKRFLDHFPPADGRTPAQTSTSLAQNPTPNQQPTQEQPETSRQERPEARRGIVIMSEQDRRMAREEILRRRGARTSRTQGRGSRSARASRPPTSSSPARNARTQYREDFSDRWLNFSNRRQ